MAGSLLKKLKSDLKKNDLLRTNTKKGAKQRAGQNHKDRREREAKVLESIRAAFNPFEEKNTRVKFSSLGRQVTGQQGKPGLSKQRGQDQRRATYQAEQKLKNKVGGVVDRRFGENDTTLSEQDKMVMRYAREKLARSRKASLFNLEDDQDLTHGGKALAFHDDFAEGDLLEEAEDEPELVNEAKRSFEAQEEGNERKKTKHEVMQEVIQKSKMHKAARQMAKEQDQNIIEELNEEEAFDALVKDLHSYDEAPKETTDVPDEYDSRLREMIFDRRAVPQNRTKTEEELAQEEKEEREQQLKQRQQRMEADADDLDGTEALNDAALFGLRTEYNETSEEEEEQPEVVPSISLPHTLKELKEALKHSHDPPGLVIRGLIDANDPSLNKGNKEKLGLFACTLCELASGARDKKQFKELVGIIRTLAPKYSDVLGAHFRKRFDKIYGKTTLKHKDLLDFALVGLLFSTSDQWHLVGLGASLAACHYLFHSVALDAQTIATGAYLCDVLLLYQRHSARYFPEVSGFLLRALAAVTDIKYLAQYARPFEKSLELDSFVQTEVEPLQLSKLASVSLDQAILGVVQVVSRLVALYKSFGAKIEVLAAFIPCLKALPQHAIVSDLVTRIENVLRLAKKEREPLKLQKHRAVGIVTHAPLFEESFNPERKYYSKTPERRELSKLQREFKQERKQNLKEIRRDAEFEARERLQEKRTESQEYHKMLSGLTNQINTQEGAEKNRYERERRSRRKK